MVRVISPWPIKIRAPVARMATGALVIGNAAAPAVFLIPNPNSIDKPNQQETNMNDKAGVAPVIRRRHPGLDQGQLELIGHLDGPARGIAGPGTGKTLAVALQRHEHPAAGIWQAPEELVLCTYSSGRGPGTAAAFHHPGHRRRLPWETFPGCASAPSMGCAAVS